MRIIDRKFMQICFASNVYYGSGGGDAGLWIDGKIIDTDIAQERKWKIEDYDNGFSESWYVMIPIDEFKEFRSVRVFYSAYPPGKHSDGTRSGISWIKRMVKDEQNRIERGVQYCGPQDRSWRAKVRRENKIKAAVPYAWARTDRGFGPIVELIKLPDGRKFWRTMSKNQYGPIRGPIQKLKIGPVWL